MRSDNKGLAKQLDQQTDPNDCPTPRLGPNAHQFPNVVVTTHENQRALFYKDLLMGKTVMVNFMTIANNNHYPVTENLAKVAHLLGDRLGRDVFIYSVSLDPEHDTPRALRDFAELYRAPPGWQFLTGERKAVEAIHGSFYGTSAPQGHGHDDKHDCSLGLIRYGNEAVGTWGAVPTVTSPEWILKRFSWVETRQPLTGPPRRKGPRQGTQFT